MSISCVLLSRDTKSLQDTIQITISVFPDVNGKQSVLKISQDYTILSE